jgi:ribokinase
MSNIEVAGLGALNVDYLYRVESILSDGEAVIDEAKSCPGGSAANTIYGLARLGVKTGFIGMVGDDAEGKTLVQDFSKVGVDTSQIRVKPGVKTGSVLCLSDRQGRRSLYVVPGANSLLTEDDVDLAYINQARLLHLSSLADDRQFKMLSQLIDKSGLTTKLSFAPGALYTARGLKALSPILSKTYVLFINQDEMQQLTGKGAIAGAEVCLNQGCRMVVVTLGRGVRLKSGKKNVRMVSYIRDAENEYPVEPVSLEKEAEVDTTGAGDAFATGFLYGLLKERGLKECGRLGAILAQLCINKTGARQGLPNSTELTRHYRQFYSKQL